MKRPYTAVFVAAAFLCFQPASSTDKRTEALNKLLENYDKRFLPIRRYDGPVRVQVTIQFLSLKEEAPNEFVAEMDLKQVWNDSRLSHKFHFNRVGSNYLYITGGSQPFWEPDTYLWNGVRSEADLEPSFNQQLLRVSKYGEVTLKRRLSAKFHCDANAVSFPWGSFSCRMAFESFSFKSTDLIYRWKEGNNSVVFPDDLYLTSLRLLDSTVHENFFHVETGNHSSVELVMRLGRISGHVVTVYLIPIAMFTITSLVSLWIKREASSAKILLSFGSLLMASLMAKFLNDSAPVIQYTKACDVYSGLSVIVIFFVLIANVVFVNAEEKDQVVCKFFTRERAERMTQIAAVCIMVVVILTCIIMPFA